MTINSRGFAHLAIVVVVVIGLAVIGYLTFSNDSLKQQFLTPSLYPVANLVTSTSVSTTKTMLEWKEYSSGAYSFKYFDPKPSDPNYGYYQNTISESTQIVNGGGHTIFVIQELDSNQSDPQTYWNNQVIENYTGISSNHYISNPQKGVDYWGEDYQNNALRDKTVLKLELKPDKQVIGKTLRIYIVPHNGKLYKLLLDYGNYADQILSTFKFAE